MFSGRSKRNLLTSSSITAAAASTAASHALSPTSSIDGGATTPLDELRDAITRIESLIEKARVAYLVERGIVATPNPSTSPYSTSSLSGGGQHKRGVSGLSLSAAIRNRGSGGGGGGLSTTSGPRGRGGGGTGAGKKQRREKRAKRGSDASNCGNDFSQRQRRTSTKKKKRGDGKGSGGDKDARFIPFDPEDEEEIVELLRRTAELVVRGERTAAVALTNRERRLRRYSGQGGENVLGNDEGVDDQVDVESHLALFEHFCERNVLTLIVNIVTGASFTSLSDSGEDESVKPLHHDDSNEESDSDAEDEDCTMLPPLTIATQAVQSVSILIQNVSRATSLYFLLSNNRVNDLINLPLDLYALAEHNWRHRDQNVSAATDSSSPLLLPKHRDYSSLEMSELSTHFVSFLKSLAMRMNAETLQFFLAYPTERAGGGHGNSAGGKSDFGMESRPASSAYFSEQSSASSFDDRKENSFSDEECPDDEKMESSLKHTKQRKKGHYRDKKLNKKDENDMTANLNVDFPLYARALEFCSSDQDSFLRVTAMNICLNTLRLAAVSDVNSTGQVRPSSSSSPSEKDDTENDTSEEGYHQPTVSSPDGVLHNAVALPFRERLAIAQHVCAPSRVESLVSPIFTRLAQFCGMLEETIREIDMLRKKTTRASADGTTQRRQSKTGGRLDDGVDSEEEDCRKKKKELRQEKQQENSKRDRLVRMFKDFAASLQDELLLLEDVLKVGLTSLNEQTIEMMFATFIYPLLLQPLLLYIQRFLTDSNSPMDSACHISPAGSEDDTNSSSKSCAASGPTHPFSMESLSNSLARSGLLRDDSNNGRSLSDEDMQSYLSKLLHTCKPTDAEPDPAPAKTALFGLASVFHFVSNKTLLRLLLTALLHPLAPESSDGFMIRSKPDVTERAPSGRIRIRVDDSDISSKGDFVSTCTNKLSYSFGRKKDMCRSSSTRKGGGSTSLTELKTGECCIFVLAPALANVLEGKLGAGVPASTRTRPNSYRRMILACIAGTEGMAELHSLTILALDKAMSALKGAFVSDILFGVGVNTSSRRVPSDGVDANGGPSSRNSNLFGRRKVEKKPSRDGNVNLPDAPSGPPEVVSSYVTEVVASLCVSVMNASITANGDWKLEFDQMAAHLLLIALTANHTTARKTTGKLIEHLRRQSGSFLAQLPSKIGEARSSIVDVGNEQHLGWTMYRIFHDPVFDSNRSVVENMVNISKDVPGGGSSYTCCVPVALKSTFQIVCDHLCKFVDKENQTEASGNDASSFHFAASSAFSHMQLDAFSRLIQDFPSIDGNSQKNDNASIRTVREEVTAQRTFHHIEDEVFATVSPNLKAALFDEDINGTPLDMNKERQPQAGSVVVLVGKTAFPCVCEVDEASSSLFTDQGACVVAEGIKWQSLYLVVLGSYMILAEPEKGGLGGNGRVVTSCRLSRLRVEKDTPMDATIASPARRLILTHLSLEGSPPGVFVFEEGPQERDKLPHSRLHCTRSSMDLWFEDDNAADRAFKVLSVETRRAKSLNGNRIRDVLIEYERLKHSNLFDWK